MTREKIANELLMTAQEIAEQHHVSKLLIESLSDQMLPSIDNQGIAAVVQDAIEGWAYTWLDVLRGGISKHEADSSDVFNALMSVPLEKHITNHWLSGNSADSTS